MSVFSFFGDLRFTSSSSRPPSLGSKGSSQKHQRRISRPRSPARPFGISLPHRRILHPRSKASPVSPSFGSELSPNSLDPEPHENQMNAHPTQRLGPGPSQKVDHHQRYTTSNGYLQSGTRLLAPEPAPMCTWLNKNGASLELLKTPSRWKRDEQNPSNIPQTLRPMAIPRVPRRAFPLLPPAASKVVWASKVGRKMWKSQQERWSFLLNFGLQPRWPPVRVSRPASQLDPAVPPHGSACSAPPLGSQRQAESHPERAFPTRCLPNAARRRRPMGTV